MIKRIDDVCHLNYRSDVIGNVLTCTIKAKH